MRLRSEPYVVVLIPCEGTPCASLAYVESFEDEGRVWLDIDGRADLLAEIRATLDALTAVLELRHRRGAS
jgi:hypothetical protein